MPRPTSRSRHSRLRRLGMLGALFAALLTPAGTLMMTLAAAALVGGAFALLHAPAPSSPAAPLAPGAMRSALHGASVSRVPRVTTHIESHGETLPIVLAEGRPFDSPVAGPDALQHFVPLALPVDPTANQDAPLRALPSTPAQEPAIEPPLIKASTPPSDGPQIVLSPRGPSQPPASSPPSAPPPRTNPPASKDTPPPGQTVSSDRATVPEPSVLTLILLGFAALLWGRRRAG